MKIFLLGTHPLHKQVSGAPAAPGFVSIGTITPGADHPPGPWDLQGVLGEDVTPGPRQSGSPATQVPPSCSDLPGCFPGRPGTPGSSQSRPSGLQPHSLAASGSVWASWATAREGASAREGEVPGTQDRSELAFVCRKSCPVPQGCGPSSRPAADLDSGSSGPRSGTFHMCVRPQSAIASPLNLVGSKLGLLAVTLAAWLSQCVFIFSFKPFWRFLSSQKGLNQMSHGTVLGGPHRAGSGSQAKLTSSGFTGGVGGEGSG